MAAFSPNSLSMALSDEQVQRELWAASAAARAPASPPATVRKMRRGRSLSQLTVDDLLRKRRSWREFVGGLRPASEFSIPGSLEEASYKLSENIFEFIGNYLLVGLGCVGCVLYKRPAALVGIVVVSLAYDWQQKQPPLSGSPRAQPASPQPASPGGWRRRRAEPEALALMPVPTGWQLRVLQVKRTLVTCFTWLVLMKSHLVPSLFIAAIGTLFAVCLHGTLRNPVNTSRRLLR